MIHIDRLSYLMRKNTTALTPAHALPGFTANPMGGTLSSEQVQMYREAFLQAQKEVEEAEWPWAESWN